MLSQHPVAIAGRKYRQQHPEYCERRRRRYANDSEFKARLKAQSAKSLAKGTRKKVKHLRYALKPMGISIEACNLLSLLGCQVCGAKNHLTSTGQRTLIPDHDHET